MSSCVTLYSEKFQLEFEPTVISFISQASGSQGRGTGPQPPQIDSVSVTCNGCVGIATVWCRGGCHQEGLRRPEEAGFFHPDLWWSPCFWHLFFIRRLFVVSMVWHSYGIHMAMMSVRLGRWTFSMRLGNASLSQIWSALPHPWKWNPFNHLQPSSILLQFCFNSASILLLLFFPKSGVASLGLCWGQKMTQTHPRQKWAVCVWTTVPQPYV